RDAQMIQASGRHRSYQTAFKYPTSLLRLPYQITMNCDQTRYIHNSENPSRSFCRSLRLASLKPPRARRSLTRPTAATAAYAFATKKYAGNNVLPHGAASDISRSIARILKPTA